MCFNVNNLGILIYLKIVYFVGDIMKRDKLQGFLKKKMEHTHLGFKLIHYIALSECM